MDVLTLDRAAAVQRHGVGKPVGCVGRVHPGMAEGLGWWRGIAGSSSLGLIKALE